MANTITGQNLRLQWSDFTGPVPRNRPANSIAFTSASFTISNFNIVQAYAAIGIRMPNAQNDLGFVIDNLRITVTLNRSRMWSVASAQTPALLTHEQGHYDIVALVMQDLFNDLVGPPSILTTTQAVQQYASGKITEAQRRIRVMENQPNQEGLYDRQTNHGLNQAPQASWNRAFSNARPPVGMRFDLSLQAQGIVV
ncbi:MAG: hypothetical protein U1F42_02235 [Candidatus Competibacteraceae bacterium]